MPAFPEYRRILDWYAQELAELPVVLRAGVVDDRLIGESRADAVVIAAGGLGRVPEVEGAGVPHVIGLRVWLRRA